MAHIEMNDVAIGNDGSAWALGREDGTIYRLYGDAGAVGWIANPIGKAISLAPVSWSDAWCVNAENEIWCLTNWSMLDGSGNWEKIATHSGELDAATVSVGRDGTVWYAQTDGTLFRRDQREGRWVKPRVAGKLHRIAAFNYNSVWGIDDSMRVHEYHKSADDMPEGQGLNQAAMVVSCGDDNTAWYLDSTGTLFRNIPGQGWSDDSKWDAAIMGQPINIDVVTGGNVWAVNDRGEVWRLVAKEWEQVGVPPKPYLPTVEEFESELARLRAEDGENLAADLESADRMYHYCHDAVSKLHAHVRAGDYAAPPEIKVMFRNALKSWDRYQADMNEAQSQALMPQWRIAASPTGIILNNNLMAVEQLSGHYKYLRMLVSTQASLMLEDYARYATVSDQ